MGREKRWGRVERRGGRREGRGGERWEEKREGAHGKENGEEER